jgi:hypothetical protein
MKVEADHGLRRSIEGQAPAPARWAELERLERDLDPEERLTDRPEHAGPR